MISCALAVCAETVVIDRLSNSISVINILEAISVESFPIVLPRVFCLFELTRDNEDPLQLPGLVTFRLGETELVRAPYEVDFQGTLRTRSVMNIQGLVISGPGLLRASVDVNGSVLGHWDMPCESRPAQIALPLLENPHDGG